MTTRPEAKRVRRTRWTDTDVPDAAKRPAATGAELESFSVTPRLPLARRSAVIQKITRLEGRLFDEAGLVRPGLSPEVAGPLLDEINDLRGDLGWLRLDQRHQPVWPADIAS